MPPVGGSFCHVREVARAHVAAAERGRVGANYLLGEAQASYLGLVQEIARLIGVRRRPVVMHPRFPRDSAAAEEWASTLFGRQPDATVAAAGRRTDRHYHLSPRPPDERGSPPPNLQHMMCACAHWM